jgi:hypothetical protein
MHFGALVQDILCTFFVMLTEDIQDFIFIKYSLFNFIKFSIKTELLSLFTHWYIRKVLNSSNRGTQIYTHYRDTCRDFVHMYLMAVWDKCVLHS